MDFQEHRAAFDIVAEDGRAIHGRRGRAQARNGNGHTTCEENPDDDKGDEPNPFGARIVWPLNIHNFQLTYS
jgi:hypothetical protein